MADFGSGQGRSDFETTGVARLGRGFQKSENAGLGRKMLFMEGCSSGQHDCATCFVAKLVRANGGCLGVKRRRKTWLAAISLGELLNKL